MKKSMIIAAMAAIVMMSGCGSVDDTKDVTVTTTTTTAAESTADTTTTTTTAAETSKSTETTTKKTTTAKATTTKKTTTKKAVTTKKTTTAAQPAQTQAPAPAPTTTAAAATTTARVVTTTAAPTTTAPRTTTTRKTTTTAKATTTKATTKKSSVIGKTMWTIRNASCVEIDGYYWSANGYYVPAYSKVTVIDFKTLSGTAFYKVKDPDGDICWLYGKDLSSTEIKQEVKLTQKDIDKLCRELNAYSRTQSWDFISSIYEECGYSSIEECYETLERNTNLEDNSWGTPYTVSPDTYSSYDELYGIVKGGINDLYGRIGRDSSHITLYQEWHGDGSAINSGGKPAWEIYLTY